MEQKEAEADTGMTKEATIASTRVLELTPAKAEEEEGSGLGTDLNWLQGTSLRSSPGEIQGEV